jgi:acetyl esterase
VLLSQNPANEDRLPTAFSLSSTPCMEGEWILAFQLKPEFTADGVSCRGSKCHNQEHAVAVQECVSIHPNHTPLGLQKHGRRPLRQLLNQREIPNKSSRKAIGKKTMHPLNLILGMPTPLAHWICGGPIRIDGISLDARNQLLFHVANKLSPWTPSSAPADIRHLLRRLPTRGVCKTEDILVSGGDGEQIPVRIYRARKSMAPAPCMVYFHGGGFVSGGIQSYDRICHHLADAAGVSIASVEYRLAPEDPFPAAVEDAYAAYRELSERAFELGLDPSRMGVGGDSAGGNLTAVLSNRLRGKEGSPIFQLLVYPVLDVSQERSSYEKFGNIGVITRDVARWCKQHYCGGENPSDPRISPLLEPDLSGLPPTYMLLAGFDILLDECMEYGRRLHEADVEVQISVAENHAHGFFHLWDLLPGTKSDIDRLARALRRAFA